MSKPWIVVCAIAGGLLAVYLAFEFAAATLEHLLR